MVWHLLVSHPKSLKPNEMGVNKVKIKVFVDGADIGEMIKAYESVLFQIDNQSNLMKNLALRIIFNLPKMLY